METFCNSTFWNTNLTWHTSDPYFTPCFEETVLTWIPPAFIFLFSFIDIRFTLNAKQDEHHLGLTWSLLSRTRFCMAITIACVALAQVIVGQFYANYGRMHNTASTVRLAGLVLALLLMVLSTKTRLTSSGVQFIYWSLTLICEVTLFRTAVNKHGEVFEKWKFIYTMRFITFPLVVMQFVLHCISDREWITGHGIGKGQNYAKFESQSPEIKASYFSNILYCWFDSMAWRGYRNPLEFTDLWDLNETDRAIHLMPIFNHRWKKATEAVKRKATQGSEGAGVGRVLFNCYWKPFIVAGLMKLIQDLLPLVSPEILKLLIAHVADTSEEPWKGYLYAAVLISCSLLATIFGVQHNEWMLRIGMWTRSVLTSAINRKSLTVSNVSGSGTATGQVLNLISADIQRLMELAPFVHMVWTAPIQIGLSLYFLYNTLGMSILAGLGVIILCVPLNGFLTAKQSLLQMEQLKFKDKRIKLMGEILSGIKTLKLYGWEPALQKQVEDIRRREIDLLRQIAYYSSATTFSFNCLPLVVALATFGVYVFTGDDHNLNAERTFVALSLFNIMRMPMVMFPMTVTLILQSVVSLKRINEYLNLEELEPNVEIPPVSQSNEQWITIRNGNFSWTSKSMTLKDIDVTFKKGTLTAIVGDVGSGKTSLLSVILGEITKKSGSVNVQGSIAYVSQQAWIQNATIRDNIVFGDLFNASKYKLVVEACGLVPDIQNLEGGDDTEIGERGMNLSGGQKQRVSIARAVYKESDVYLFDDPLSALDAGVGNHIFDNVIGSNGCLKNCTRVLVTHGLSFLSQADKVIVLKHGQVSHFGTYNELLQTGMLADYLSGQMATDKKDWLMGRTFEGMKEAEQLPIPISLPQVTRDSPHEKKKLVQDELSETGNIKASVLATYLQACGFYLVISMTVFSLLQIGLASYTNIWLANWAAEATKDGMNHDGLQQMDTTTKYLGGYGGMGLAQCLAIVLCAIAAGLATLNSAAALHSKILEGVLRAPMSFFDTTLSGRLVNYFAKDVDVLDNFMPLNVKATINSFCSTLSLIINIVYSTPIFVTFILPVTVFYFFLQRFYIATSRQIKRIEAITRSPIYSCISETISGATTIRAFGLQEAFMDNMHNKIDHNQQAYSPLVASTLWINVRLEIIGALVTFAAAIFSLDARGEIDPAIVGLSISSSLAITQQLKFLVKLMSELETNVVSAERITELSNTPQEAAWFLKKRPSKDWPERGEVVFQKYETRYRNGLDLVLKCITCRILPGEKIGIVGRTGAGKSSLTLALFRLIEPAGGTICIDGHDITTFGLHDLRSSITIIPQDPVLFSGTLRMNLDPFDNSSEIEIWKCLESAHLKSYVETLPEGLDFEVYGEGSCFSSGQRQLVCLARAFLRKSNIIVLDEATAAVDVKTDELILNTMRTQFVDRTVITIAHRIHSIMDSSRILVLENGKIVEFDCPKKLMADHTSNFYGMAKLAGVKN